MNEDKFIQVNNLEKTYENGYQAIKSVSFSVKKGDLVCLLGPSGCGKTTTLNMIAGLLNPTGGDIIVMVSLFLMLRLKIVTLDMFSKTMPCTLI